MRRCFSACRAELRRRFKHFETFPPNRANRLRNAKFLAVLICVINMYRAILLLLSYYDDSVTVEFIGPLPSDKKRELKCWLVIYNLFCARSISIVTAWTVCTRYTDTFSKCVSRYSPYTRVRLSLELV